ncbi:MAG: hypothetical protein OES26_09950, partial [Gammaproteobacteria bacterium]|nr:hypothetical protein [Gammaproteobacteria bacterium]
SANIMRFTAANVAAFDAVSTGIRLDDSRRIALGNGSDAKFAFINAVGLQLTLENGIPFQILDGNTGNAVRFDFDVDLGDLQIDGNLDLAYIDGYAGTPTDGQSLRWNSANARAEFASQTVTTVATTSGTGAKDLSTTIPAWATEITISLSSFSTNGTVMPVIQVGNGTYVTTGYLGSARRISGTAALHSTGFRFGNTWAAAYIVHGSIKLVKHDSTGDIWSCFGNIARSGTAMNWVLAGSIDLSGALDRVRVTIGADTYDGGSIAIRYS